MKKQPAFYVLPHSTSKEYGVLSRSQNKKQSTLSNAVLISILILIFLSGLINYAKAQVTYATAGSSYTQNFDNLYGSVPANNTTVAASTLPTGWLFTEAGSNANTTLRNDNGSSGTGDTYLNGATSSNERSLGSYASGSLTSQFGVFLINNTGTTLTQFTLSYTGEQWKDGGSSSAVLNTLSFAYAINPTSLTSGTYTNATSLDFTALVNNTTADVTLDGNLAANQRSVSATISGISWGAGQTLYLRWTDINDAGNDDNLSIDGLSFSASSAVPSIAIAPSHPSAGSINQGSADNIIGAVSLGVTTASATLNSVNVTTAGTYAAADITNFKLWLSSSASSISGATQLGSTFTSSLSSGSTLSATSLSNSISSGSTRFIVLTASIASSATAGNTVSMNTTAFSNISFATGTKTGTDPVSASGNQTIAAVVPSIALSNAGPAAGTINQSSTNNILSSIQMTVTNAGTILNGITLTTGGTYQTSDLQANSFKVWYNTSNNLTGATLLGTAQAIVASGGNISLSGLTRSVPVGTSFILVSADASYNAGTSRNISIASTAFSNITFSNGTKTGTDPVNAGNAQTFGAVTSSIDISQASTAPATQSISFPSTNNLLDAFKLTVTNNSVDLNSIAVTTGGTYTSADVVAGSLKLWYNTTNTFSSATQIGTSQSVPASGGTATFSGLAQFIANGTSSFLWVTFDAASTATSGRNINIAAAPFSSFTFSQGTKTGTDPVTAGNVQTLIAVPVLTEVILPQYMQGNTSTNSNRLPYVYRATISNLNANATYRYYNQVVNSSDGAAVDGAGNVLFAASAGFTRTTTPSMVTAGAYSTFTTDATGTYTGWFVTEPTGNSRFASGSAVYMRIMLNDGNNGTTVATRITTTNTVQVLNLGTTSVTGTGLYSLSAATVRNFVFLYDNTSGSGRPVSGTYVESDGVSNTSGNSYASFYATNVEAVGGAYGTIIPNANTSGIRRIEQRDFNSGAVIGCPATDNDGTWPSGANTVNPSGGGTAVVISASDAPLGGTFAITASAAANGSISPAGITNVSCGNNQTYTITANSCYQISDVVVNGVSQGPISSYTFTDVRSANTISASFSVITYNIAASSGANGSISSAGTTAVNCGANQTYNFTPNSCYQVANVVVNGVSQGALSSYTFTNVTAPQSISVSFSLSTYNIVASSGANGSISSAGTTAVNCGANQTYNFTANSCYQVSDVIVDGVSQGALSSYTFTNVTAPHNISVSFVLSSYNIVASSGANGSISSAGTTAVNCGANQTYNFTANSCYQVSDVIVDGVSQGSLSSYTFSNVTAPHSISVSFSIVTYNIVAISGANGNISSSGTIAVNCGDNQTYNFSANSCYEISDVVVDGVSQGALSSYTFSNVTAPHSISVSFSSAFLTPAVSISANTGNTICSGTTVIFTANPLNGGSSPSYQWKLNGTLVGSGSTYTNSSLSNGDAIVCSMASNHACAQPTNAVSNVITMTVDNSTVAGSVSTNTTVCSGTNSGTLTLSGYTGTIVKWQSSANGFTTSNDIANTAASYTFNNLTQATAFRAVVQNGTCPSDNSSAATVSLNEAPVISCPSNIITSNDAGICGAIVSFTATATGVPSPTVTYSSEPDSLFNIDTTIVYVSATNSCGTANCSFSVIVKDTENPVSSAADTVTVQTDAGVCYVAKANLTQPAASDNCGTLNYTNNAPSQLATGNHTVIWTVTDGSGNSISVPQVMIVQDNQSPLITAPASITTTADAGSCYKTNLNIGSANATDNCGIASVTNDAPSNFPIGTTTVTWTATDIHGNITMATQQITITSSGSPISMPASITGSTTICANAMTNITYVAAPVTGATSYVWYGTAPVTIVSGQGTNTVTVSFTSTMTTAYLYVAASNLCGTSAGTSLAITKAASPAMPGVISGASVNICATSGTYSVVAVNGMTYNWTVPTGVTVSSGQGTNSITVAYGSTFTSGTVSVTAGNSCSTSTARTLAISKSPATPGIINGVTTNACTYSSTAATYSVAAVAGATSYTWAVPVNATLVSGQGTNTITVNFTSGYTTGAITVFASNSCANSAVKSLTVSGLPATPGIISGLSANVCASTGTYSVAAVSGATSYTWTVPAGVTISAGQGTNAISVAYGSTFVSGNVTVYASNSCSNSAVKTLAISKLPATPGTINGPSTNACTYSSTAATYSVAAVAGATSYTWAVPANATLVSGQGTNTITVNFTSGYTTGAITVYASNSCANSAVKSLTVSGLPATPGTISGPTTNACTYSSTAATYSVAAVAGATTYTWAVPANATLLSGQGTNAITVNFNSSYTSGNVTVYASNACSNSSVRTLAVSGLPSTPGTISGLSANVCASTGTYSVAAVSGATSYTWTVPTGVTISAGQGTNAISVAYGSTFVSGNVTVYASNSCSNSAVKTLAISKLPATPGTINGPSTNACTYSSTAATYSVAAVAGATSYTWAVPANATLVSGQGTNTITVNFTSGYTTGAITVYASNSCANSAVKSLTVSGLPATPGTISGPTVNACSNSPATYSIAAVAGASSYTWAVPVNATLVSGQGTNTITVNFNSSYTSGNVTVYASNACSNSSVRTLAVSGLPSTPGAISGPATNLCGTSGNTYSVSPVAGAVSYTWTIPSGATITSGANTNSITIDFGTVLTSATVKVYASNSCGKNSAVRSVSLTNCNTSSMGKMNMTEENTSSDLMNVSVLYPNPCKETFSFDIEIENAAQIQIQILDISGKVISNRIETVYAGKTTISNSLNEEISEGIYFLNIINKTNGKKELRKFIVQK